MKDLLKQLNEWDKRVEICKNYSKERVIAKLNELQDTAD